MTCGPGLGDIIRHHGQEAMKNSDKDAVASGAPRPPRLPSAPPPTHALCDARGLHTPHSDKLTSKRYTHAITSLHTSSRSLVRRPALGPPPRQASQALWCPSSSRSSREVVPKQAVQPSFLSCVFLYSTGVNSNVKWTVCEPQRTLLSCLPVP